MCIILCTCKGTHTRLYNRELCSALFLYVFTRVCICCVVCTLLILYLYLYFSVNTSLFYCLCFLFTTQKFLYLRYNCYVNTRIYRCMNYQRCGKFIQVSTALLQMRKMIYRQVQTSLSRVSTGELIRGLGKIYFGLPGS